ncbi:MAG: sugar phosphate nucleotidyltransferase [Armatimonadota bacterium]
MKAVVMAGGEGTRLRPLTSNRPKPLVPILGKPIAQHIVEHLRRAGITDIVVTLYYLGEEIRGYFGDGSELGVNLIYSVEETPLGTAGSVKQAEDILADDTFLIVSGDALTSIDIAKAVAFHKEKGAEATLVLQQVANPLEFGVVMTEPDGRIKRFLEKPSWGEVFSDTVNTGMYILEPSVFDLMEPGRNIDWSQEIFPKLLELGRPIYGYVMEEYWCDVGSLDQYRQAQYEMLAGMTGLPIDGSPRAAGIHVGPGSEIDPTAVIAGPVSIGANCRIMAGARLGPDAVVGDNVLVAEDAQIAKAIVWDGCYVGRDAKVFGCTLCNGVTVKDGARIEEGAVVGDRCHIEGGATIRGGVKLWPDKVIEAGSHVTESLIWGAKAHSALFRGLGVPGLANVEITPEFATKLGASYGAFLKKGATVVTSRDSHPASRMVKRALLSGLCSVGVNCIDLQAMPLPLARAAIGFNNAQGGINLRVDPDNPRDLIVEFFDNRGIYLTKNAERKIETIFTREDYGRADMTEVGQIQPAPTTVAEYMKVFLSKVKQKDIERRRFRVVVDYAYSGISTVLPELLGGIGCDVIALNGYTDWRRKPQNADDRQAMIRNLADVVGTLKADLGVLIYSNGERLELVDETGRTLYGARLLATIASMVAQTGPGARIAVPVTAPSTVERIVSASGGTVVRTKTDPRFLMTIASVPAERIALAGDLRGGLAFPDFHPAFDGLYAFVRVLEMLSWLQQPMSAIADALPPMHLANATVRCPWDVKGAVMRTLTEEAQSATGTVELLDGIRIADAPDDWVLILPDDAEPTFVIHAEGPTATAAQQTVDRWSARIDALAASL